MGKQFAPVGLPAPLWTACWEAEAFPAVRAWLGVALWITLTYSAVKAA